MNKKIIIGIIIIITAAIIGLGEYVFYQAEEVTEENLTEEQVSNATEKAQGKVVIESDSEDKTEEDITSPNLKDNKESEEETASDSQKVLIAYFSRADENYSVGTVDVGNTEIMAGFIKEYLGDKADEFKIDPAQSYPTDYKECTEVATEEKNSNARPEFKNANSLNIDDYDTIFIGYPIWWGDVPMIINTFLEKYDFSGKTIIPFNTHEGSGNSGTYTSIKNKMKSSTVNTDGLAIRGKDAREEKSRNTVENWLKGLGY